MLIKKKYISNTICVILDKFKWLLIVCWVCKKSVEFGAIHTGLMLFSFYVT